MPSKEDSVIVVGAGVIGLSIALALKQNGYKDVTVVAEYLPHPDAGGNSPYYTSTKAGAHFRPFPSKSESDVRESEYTRVTYKFFKQLAGHHPESSIKFVRGYDWIDDPTPEYKSLQVHYRKEMPNFEKLDSSQLSDIPAGVSFACGYDTWVLNAPLYVAFLYRRLAFHYGVTFVQKKLKSLSQVPSLFPGKKIAAVINATATGLLWDGSLDPKCFPIRGQTLLLNVPPSCQYLNKTITHQNIAKEEWTFVIPRPLDGGLILGGTKQVNSTEPQPIKKDVTDLLDRARRIFPDLFVDGKDPKIEKINVGFRPARKTGSRVELEELDPSSGAKYLVHAYGNGGMGFEASYGMALHALKLLENKMFIKSSL